MCSTLKCSTPDKIRPPGTDILCGAGDTPQTKVPDSQSGKSPLTSQRKDEHISICLEEEVSFRKKNGFEKYDFVHRALPELNLADIDTSTTFLGKPFSNPYTGERQQQNAECFNPCHMQY